MFIGDTDTDAQFNGLDVSHLLSSLDINGFDLSDSANTQTIWDTSAGHIPETAVQQGSGSGLDADTVDGYDAKELRNSKNIAQLSSTDTTTDLNTTSWVTVPWNTEYTLDGAYSHDSANSPGTITFNEAGTYRVFVSLAYDSSGTRNNPGIKLNVNGTRKKTFGLSGYVRNQEGHDEGSNVVQRTITVNANDTLKVQTIAMADTGTITMRSEESILEVEQLSSSVSMASDADTLDGLDSTQFLRSDKDTTLSGGTLGVDLTDGGDSMHFTDTSGGTATVYTNRYDSLPMRFWAGGTASTTLYMDQNNRVGIQTEAPSYAFDVSGTANITNSLILGNDLNMSKVRLTDWGALQASGTSDLQLKTDGTGSDKVSIRDTSNSSQNIAVFNEGGNVRFPHGSVTQGNDPADTITETTSPKGFDFSGNDDRDIHNKTEVTVSNGSTASATETITVELYDGIDTTGTLLQSESKSVTVAAGGSKTVSFIGTDELLNNGTYHINVTQSGTTLSVDQTDEFTRGAAYTFQQTNNGILELRTLYNHKVFDVDPRHERVSLHGNRVEFDESGNFIRGGTASFTTIKSGSGAEVDIKSNLNMNNYTLRNPDPLNMNDGTIYWQPASAGGSVTAMKFQSNTNSGSDMASIEFHDDYLSSGSSEDSGLVFRTENDPNVDSSGSQDNIYLDPAGEARFVSGRLNMSGHNIVDDDGSTLVWDATNNYVPASSVDPAMANRTQNETITGLWTVDNSFQINTNGYSLDLNSDNNYRDQINIQENGTDKWRLDYTNEGLLWHDATNNLTALEYVPGGDIRIPNGSVTQGKDPADTITETTSPKGFDFSGNDGRDIHNKTDVTVSNGSTASATETITVELYDGVDTTGTLLQSQSQSVTVAAGGSKTVSFIGSDELLNNGTYHINVTQSGTTLSVDQTDEFTKGATYTFQQSNNGMLELRTLYNSKVFDIDPRYEDLSLNGNRIRNVGYLEMDGRINMSGNHLDNVGDIEMDGNIHGSGVDIGVQEVGRVLGPNNGDTDLTIETQGSGSHSISLRDGFNSATLLQVHESGPVEVLNTDLINRNNTLLDPGSSGLADGGSINSGHQIFRGYYDSDGTTSVTAATADAEVEHVVKSGGGSVLDLRVQNSDIIRAHSGGNVVVPGRIDVNGVGGTASNDGSPGIGAPTVYTNMVEAPGEKGTGSTYVELGAGGYHSSIGADDIGLVTQGNVQFVVDDVGDTHAKNQLYESGNRVATRTWVNSNSEIGMLNENESVSGSWTFNSNTNFSGANLTIDTAGNALKLNSDNSSRDQIRISENGTSKWRLDYDNESIAWRDMTNTTDILRLNPNGPVDMHTDVRVNNNNINGVNNLKIDNPGGAEGVQWQNWHIFESPDDFSNSSGSFQLSHNGTRAFTVDTNNNVEVPNGAYKTSNFEMRENSTTNSLDFNYTGA